MTSLAFLVDQLFAAPPGGMGTYVRELVPALSRADPSLEITLFHSRFGRQTPEEWVRRYETIELTGSIRRLYPGWALGGRPALPPEIGSRDRASTTMRSVSGRSRKNAHRPRCSRETTPASARSLR